MTGVKYTLSKRVDAVVDRRINKEFRRRQTKDKLGYVTDPHLKSLLDPRKQAGYYDLDKRATLQDLKDEVRNLYFESLMDFLKSQNIILIAQFKGRALCNFKNVPVILDALPSINHRCYYSHTWLSFFTKKQLTEPDIWMCAQIQPWIEVKIEDIADFVIRRHSYMPVFEASKTVKKKTDEERTHVEANGRRFIEHDMYALTRYCGHKLGKELFGAEKYIRSNYKLEDYTLDSESKSKK